MGIPFHLISFSHISHIIIISDIPESYLCLGLGIYSWWLLWLFCDSFLKTFTATSHACSDLLQCCKILRSRVSFFHFHNIVVFMIFYWWPCCPPSTWRAGRLTFIWTLTFDLCSMFRSARSQDSHQHSFLGHWYTQATPPRQGTSLNWCG